MNFIDQFQTPIARELTPSLSQVEAGRSRLRLRTITRLRWLAVIGQTIAIIVVHWGLGFELPVGWCFLLIALSAWLNIFLRMRCPTSQHIKRWIAFSLLGYDILQLSGLLALTGGLQNPFALLLVVPVTVSAASQRWPVTVALGLLASACLTLMAFYHYPLPWYPGQEPSFSITYFTGLWVAIISGMVFMGFYVWRIAREARLLSDALNATETVMAREQRLSALDGLAAAAAHELGTPLGTIAVVAKELERECGRSNTEVIVEDIKLLRSQAERCRGILSRLTSRRDQVDLMHQKVELSGLLEEVVQPHRVFEKKIAISAQPDPITYPTSEKAREPEIGRHPGLIYALGNLVENAVDFAETRVDVIAEWSGDTISITISDDGPGFDPSVMEQIGEPYVTTRPHPETTHEADENIGMGLGFFIAKTFIERSGGVMVMGNKEFPDHGAIIQLRWPRHLLDIELKEQDQD